MKKFLGYSVVVVGIVLCIFGAYWIFAKPKPAVKAVAVDDDDEVVYVPPAKTENGLTSPQ